MHQKQSSDSTKFQKKENFIYKISHPHFRIATLMIYLVVIALFNIVIAPLLGLDLISKASASSISTSRLVSLANSSRAAGGLGALTVDQRLVNAATNKAIDMFKKQYWAHYGPNGESPWQFIKGAGYSYIYAGENLAKDFGDSDSVHNAWMNSATHRANIMNGNYTNVGIAAISGKQICNGTYPNFSENSLSTCQNTVIVVQMFGTPPVASPPPPSQTTTPKVTTTKAVIRTQTPQQVQNTPIVTQTPVPQPPAVPSINSPVNDSSFNQTKIGIQGRADEGTTVNVYEGDRKVGSVITNGGVFDIKDAEFPEGSHVIKANSKKNDTISPESAFSTETRFSIDLTKPIFEKKNIKIQLNDKLTNEYYIEGEFAPDTAAVKATVGTVVSNLEKKYDSVFAGLINVPNDSVGIVLSAYDKAGNEHVEEIKLPDTPLSQGIGLFSPPSSDNENSLGLNNKQIINIVIGVILLMIFIGDAVVVWRSGHTHGSHAKHHKHHKTSGIHHVVPVLIVVLATATSILPGVVL